MINYFLIKEEYNYSDEFYTKGFTIVKTTLDEEGLKERIINNILEDKQKFPCEFYFGTNESHLFEDEQEVLSGLNIIKIEADDYQTIKHFFGNFFGIVVISDYALYDCEEN